MPSPPLPGARRLVPFHRLHERPVLSSECRGGVIGGWHRASATPRSAGLTARPPQLPPIAQ
eukprot:1139671-Alexandrium_andersonii.AAC.1